MVKNEDLNPKPAEVETPQPVEADMTQALSPRFSAREAATIQRQGFKLLGESYIPHIDTQYLFLEHDQTGAKVIIALNDDPHLRAETRLLTFPTNSSGVFHKLEHATISDPDLVRGINDIFDECMRSLFLSDVNATTSPHMTKYYASGDDRHSVEQMTSVFVKSILNGAPSNDTFLREHGHLRPDAEATCGFRFGGVVHDEMLAAYANPERIVYRKWVEAVFPNTYLAHDSGGDPSVMASLTYKDFQQAYEDNYAASKLFIGLYGAVELSEQLTQVNELLQGHERGETAPSFPEPIPQSEPVSVETSIPADLSSPTPSENQHRFRMNWKFPVIDNHQTDFEMRVLAALLSPGEFSPFTQAYRSSGIPNVHAGAAYYRMGAEEIVFLDFTNSTRDDVTHTREVAEELLKTYQHDGFPDAAIQALLASWELNEEKRNRSVRIPNLGSFVNDARLADGLNNAIHGKYEVDTLSIADRAEVLREKLRTGESVFQNLISKYLLDNSNRTDVTFVPDLEWQKNWIAKQEAGVAATIASMSTEELDAVRQTAVLAQEREQANVASDVPTSAPKAELREELRKEPSPDRTVIRHQEATILHHEQDLKGQARVDFNFDMTHLPPEKIPLTQFMFIAMNSLGPEGYQQGQLDMEMMQLSGGSSVAFDYFIRHDKEPEALDSTRAISTFRGTVRPERCESFMDIAAKILTTPQLDNRDFLRHLARSATRATTGTFNEPGSITGEVGSHLLAAMHPSGSIGLALSSEGGLRALREISNRIETDFDGLVEDMRSLHKSIVRQGNLTLNVTCDAECWTKVEPEILVGVNRYFGESALTEFRDFNPQFNKAGLRANLNNNYVGLRARLTDESGDLLANDGAMYVASALLDRHVNRTVRQQGGAYDTRVHYAPASGHLTMLSGRDPHITRTVAAYKNAAQFLSGIESEDLLHRAKVHAFMKAGLKGVRSPEDVGTNAMFDFLSGDTVQGKEQLRSAILYASLDDVQRIARALQRSLDSQQYAVRVFGNQANLAQADSEGLSLAMSDRLEPES